MNWENKINRKESLTFDDVLLVPSKSDVLPSEVNIETHLTKKIKLKVPVLSAAMDTVTESSLAISLAREGGIGIIHKNMNKETQSEEVSKVKKSESWIIRKPKVLSPGDNLSKATEIQSQSGISSFPVIKNGKLVGMLTNRDKRFEQDPEKKVSELMTKNIITISEGVSIQKSIDILSKHKIEKLPIVSKTGELKGLITMTDIEKNRKFPNATKDSEGRLLVGAAVGPFDKDRIDMLVKNDVDVLVIDSAHGHSKNIIECLKDIKRNHDVEVIAGNIATPEAAEDLISAGADAVKVGIGSGSICISRVVAGVGVPQITAVMECAEAAQSHGITVISDGGTRYSGDIAKAIAAGAHSVMLGSLVAGADESPGRVVFIQGRKFKSYRGMGSLSAMELGSSDRYSQFDISKKKLVPEGIEGIVPYRGSFKEILYQLLGGLKSAMGYCGCSTIEEFRLKTQLRKISHAGVIESHPHDVVITEEAPNYWKSARNY